jgi:hypothetical protein
VEPPADPWRAGPSLSGPVLQRAELGRPKRRRRGWQAAADWPAETEKAEPLVGPQRQVEPQGQAPRERYQGSVSQM